MEYAHLFGPVSSRRLGRSLGVDLVPYKTCTFDCVYCEVGRTTCETTERTEFFPVREVTDELGKFLSTSPRLDFITFSGSGEPSLSLSIGAVMRFIKDRFPGYRLAVLTNGSLLWREDVRADLLMADVVLPTLSTVREDTFRRIHRPCRDITIQKVIRGLREFRDIYRGEIWLEIFLIPGINMGEDELAALGEEIQRIRPDRVQLNTLDRPGAEEWVRPATPEELAHAGELLGLRKAEAIESVRYGSPHARSEGDPASLIIEILKRRPSTLRDLMDATGMHRQETIKLLRELSSDPRLTSKKESRGLFYSWIEDVSRTSE